MVFTDSKASDLEIQGIEPIQDAEKLKSFPLDAHYDPAFVKKTMWACSSLHFQGL